MEIIETIGVLKKEISKFREQDLKVGFVPTMGALHDGHISLIEKARQDCDVVVVSIFVNPAQFGPEEDLLQYPRDLGRDSKFCEEKNVDILFVPSGYEIYPTNDDALHISFPKYTTRLCGKFRPGHFDGVLLVMTKLLNIVEPDSCFMGKKDGQQLIIVDKLIKELNLEIELVGCPTLREATGLAMSSRNVYLNEEEYGKAQLINQTLERISTQQLNDIETAIAKEISKLQDVGLIVQYLELVDRENLDSVSKIETGKYMLCIAALCGSTRLIDNYFIDIDEQGEVKIDRGLRIDSLK